MVINLWDIQRQQGHKDRALDILGIQGNVFSEGFSLRQRTRVMKVYMWLDCQAGRSVIIGAGMRSISTRELSSTKSLHRSLLHSLCCVCWCSLLSEVSLNLGLFQSPFFHSSPSFSPVVTKVCTGSFDSFEYLPDLHFSSNKSRFDMVDSSQENCDYI